jgi:hypothetical protein
MTGNYSPMLNGAERALSTHEEARDVLVNV